MHSWEYKGPVRTPDSAACVSEAGTGVTQRAATEKEEARALRAADVNSAFYFLSTPVSDTVVEEQVR